MNHVFRVVWNDALGVWQAVAERVRGRGKTKSKRLRRIALAVGLMFGGAAHASGLPTGGSITAGSGSIHQHGNHLTVNQGSGKLAIDWQSFSIGKNNSVTFHQPSASAVALNRVLGPDVSVIQGALNANGQVFLVNPNGVLFTPTAQVNVGGLVASALHLSKEDFLAGNYRFEGDSGNPVINRGSINAAHGGTIALIAANIENTGNITAQGGNVLLGAGSKVTLDLGGPVKLEVEEGALDALVKNGGAIRADGGTILLTAKAAEDLASTVINNDGIIEAQSLVTGERGEIVLLGENGAVDVAGTLDVSGERGGKAVVTGERVLIADGARIDATGTNGGGEIYVGGGWQGKDPAIKQATATVVMQGATLDASATDNGDGGTIVAWSDVNKTESITRVAGTLKARGGANGGDGGRIETSGHALQVGYAPDVSAAQGNGGEWLIDPYNITIVAGGGNSNINAGNPFESTGDGATLDIDLIDAALGGGDVTIQTGAGGTQEGDITWNAAYTYTGGDARTLTLNAHRNIVINQSLGSNNGALSMHFKAGLNAEGDVTIGNSIATRGGDLTVLGDRIVVSGSGTTITTTGGDIRLGGGDGSFDALIDPLEDQGAFGAGLQQTAAKRGIEISGATLDAGGGDVDVRGDNEADYGVHIYGNAALKTSGMGTISVAGRSMDANGVHLQTGGKIDTENGDIEILSQAGRMELHGSTTQIAATGAGAVRIRSTGEVMVNAATLQVHDGTLDVAAGAMIQPIQEGRIRSTGAGDIDLRSRTAIHIGGSTQGHINATGTGDIILAADDVLGNSYGTLTGNAAIWIKTFDANTAIEIGTGAAAADRLEVTDSWLSKIASGGFTDVIFGRTDGTGDVNVGNATLSQDTTIQTGGHIALNGLFSIGTKDLVLRAGDGVSQSASGGVTATNLSLLGAGDFVLTGSNNDVDTLAAAVDGALSYAASDVLTIGSIDALSGIGAAGDVLVDVKGGDLTVSRNVATTGAGASIALQAADDISIASGVSIESQGGAITLNADRDANGTGGIDVPDATLRSNGGDIVMRGGSAALAVLTDPLTDAAAYGAELQATAARGITLAGATIDAGGGDVVLRGDNDDGPGVYILDNAVVQTSGDGSVSIAGRSTATGVDPETPDDDSINVRDGAKILTENGDIELFGVGDRIEFHNEPYTNTSRNPLAHASGSGSIRVRSVGRVMLNAGTMHVADGDLDVDATGQVEAIWGGAYRSTGAGDIVLTSRSAGIWIGGSLATSLGEISAAGAGDIVLTSADGFRRGRGTLQGANQLILRASDPTGALRIGDNVDDQTLLQLQKGWITMINNAGFSNVSIEGAGDVTVGDVTINKDLGIQADGAVALNGTLSTGSNHALVLQAGDGISQSASAKITSSKLTVLGLGDFDLSANGNDVGLLAANVDGAFTYVNNGALTIGDSGAAAGVTATGPIDIATRAGDLDIQNAIATDDATAGAVVLNAGRDTAAGTATGGDINITTGSVTTGAGGRATLYTGSIVNSEGVVAAAGGSGSGRFRYGSDETTTNYTAALGTGTHVVYREQPTLVVTPGTASGQYGDAPDLSGVSVTATGYVNGDTDGLGGTAVLQTDATATSNVGGYDIAYVSGLESALGYALDTSATGTYTVDPRVLSLEGSRIYDGGVNLDAGIFTLVNLLTGDTLTLTGVGTMADKHAGDGKAVTLGTLTLADGADGTLASNYTLAGGTHTVDIEKRTVTVSGITAADKVYDGGTAATVDATGVQLANLIAGDDLTVSSTGTFANKDAGTGRTVNLTNTYGGDDLINYDIVDQATTTADIARKALTVAGSFTADDKTYDGSTAATIHASGLSVFGLVAGEDLDVSGFAASFADKNVGNGILVSLDGATLADGVNGQASNYQLDLTDAPTTTANITPKSLTVSGAFTANDKIYDGTTVAVIDATGLTLSGLVAGEDLNLSYSGSFADKNAGNGILVSLDANSLTDGVNGKASNYQLDLTGMPTATANILRRAVTVIANDQSKMQGTADPALTYTAEAQSAVRGLVAGESLFGALARAAGDGVGRYAIEQGTLTDANNGNYTIEFVPGTFTVLPATEVETAQHVSQIAHERVSADSRPEHPDRDAASTSSAASGDLQFVEVEEDSTQIDPNGAEQAAVASAADHRGESATIYVVRGGIKLPSFEAALAER